MHEEKVLCKDHRGRGDQGQKGEDSQPYCSGQRPSTTDSSQLRYLESSVADPGPYVFEPTGSGSISQSSKKNLDSYCFVTSF